jgi:hypothetical protein
MEVRINMKIIEKDFNIETNEETIIERDETPEEAKSRIQHEKELAAIKVDQETKLAAKKALFTKLGLTDEEVDILLS